MLSDIGTLYEGTVEIPKKIVNSYFYYLYYIVPFGRIENQVYEYYFFHEKKDRYRFMKVPDKGMSIFKDGSTIMVHPILVYHRQLGHMHFLFFQVTKYHYKVKLHTLFKCKTT